MEATVQEGRSGVFFVHGPCGLGKRTFLESLVASGDRGIVVESDIEGVRSVRSRTDASSFVEDVHDAVILDCDKMSLPAQDACLKLLEEPPSGCRIWMHASDPSGIGQALLSRKREEFRWAPLPRDEMATWAAEAGDVDPLLFDIAAGRPGCYSTMKPDPRFKVLHDLVVQAMVGTKNPLLEPLPQLLAELDGESPLRETVFLALSHAAKTDPVRGVPVLKFASKILSTSLNVELHWFTAMAVVRR